MSQYTYQRPRYKQKIQPFNSGFMTILLIYVLPFIVINGIIFYLVTAKPKYDISVGETHDYMSTTMTFSIDSFLPTKNLSIMLNSEPLELEPIGKKTYTATIKQNGVLEIYLENFNGMAVSAYEHVNVLDDDLPNISSYTVEDGILSVYVSDSQSGIDFTSLQAVDSEGTPVAPLSVDKLNAQATFSIDSSGLTIFVSDMSGNELEQPFSLTEGETVTDEVSE